MNLPSRLVSPLISWWIDHHQTEPLQLELNKQSRFNPQSSVFEQEPYFDHLLAILRSRELELEWMAARVAWAHHPERTWKALHSGWAEADVEIQQLVWRSPLDRFPMVLSWLERQADLRDSEWCHRHLLAALAQIHQLPGAANLAGRIWAQLERGR